MNAATAKDAINRIRVLEIENTQLRNEVKALQRALQELKEYIQGEL